MDSREAVRSGKKEKIRSLKTDRLAKQSTIIAEGANKKRQLALKLGAFGNFNPK